MTDLSDIEALAADYVLGTLDPAERTAVAARRQREPGLDGAILAWERRLGPLAETVAPVAPPGDVFANIQARITAGPLADLAGLKRSRDRWRTGALVASALAAALVLALGGLEYTGSLVPVTPQSYVAVLQKDGASPAFLLSVDLTSRTLSVRRVAAALAMAHYCSL